MRVIRLSLVVGSIVIAGAVGCGASPPSPTAPQRTTSPSTTPQRTSTSATPPTAAPVISDSAEQAPNYKTKLDIPPYGASSERIMHAQFNDALLIREAVIAGRPEDAANPATVIANAQNLNDLPEGWRPFVEDMQQTASRLTNSTSAATVAAAAADLGISCGACHQQLGGPKASTEPAPARGTTVESRMDQHIWATERLWESLSVPATEAWSAGAKVLSTDPFPQEVLKQGGIDVRTAANDFTKLVAQAPTKTTTRERAALYAELLVTCGTCHQAMEQAQ